MNYNKQVFQELIRGNTGNQPVKFLITGNSMLPTIKKGDYICVDPARQYDLRAGDIICYLRGDEFVTHRLLFKKHGLWRAKGDHLWGLDAPIESNQIIGRVIAVNRDEEIIDIFHNQNVVNRTIMVIINTLMIVLSRLFPSLLNKGRKPFDVDH